MPTSGRRTSASKVARKTTRLSAQKDKAAAVAAKVNDQETNKEPGSPVAMVMERGAADDGHDHVPQTPPSKLTTAIITPETALLKPMPKVPTTPFTPNVDAPVFTPPPVPPMPMVPSQRAVTGLYPAAPPARAQVRAVASRVHARDDRAGETLRSPPQ